MQFTKSIDAFKRAQQLIPGGVNSPVRAFKSVNLNPVFIKKAKGTVITDIDGVKIDFPNKWVHLRKSNTEPIIRIYSEAQTVEEADNIGKEIINIIKELN